MAASQTVPSFDDIIQADRQRRKNEALAKEIFGKGRRSSTPLQGGRHKLYTGPTLASRVGVTKRSVSSNPPFKAKTVLVRAPTHQPLDRPQSTTNLRQQRDELTGIKVNNSLFNGNGITIKGLAGPYVVIASNFAPGTTSADIQSAMEPVGGVMDSCRVITASPTVIAEMVFLDRDGADAVIATFNNQMADGRLLHVYMKHGPPTKSVAPAHTAVLERQETPPEPRNTSTSYDTYQANSGRDTRRANPQLQDGTYGFDNGEERTDVEMDGPDSRSQDRRADRLDEQRQAGRGRNSQRGPPARGLYSDQLYQRPRGRGVR